MRDVEDAAVACGRRGARGSRPRTGRASPSRRTAPCARRRDVAVVERRAPESLHGATLTASDSVRAGEPGLRGEALRPPGVDPERSDSVLAQEARDLDLARRRIVGTSSRTAARRRSTRRRADAAPRRAAGAAGRRSRSRSPSRAPRRPATRRSRRRRSRSRSGRRAPVTTSAASLTSNRPRSVGAGDVEQHAGGAVERRLEQRRRDGRVRAASAARFSPEAVPMPISAEPASRMIVRTSAKSRLTSPGTVIRSVMPWTPWRRMSSAMRNASVTGVFFSTTCSSRSFSITISVSTRSRRLWMPTLGLLGAPAALEAERPRDDADRQRLELAPELGHDRCGAGARAAALAGGDEDHVGALERLLQLVAALLRGGERRPPGRRRRRGRASPSSRCGSSRRRRVISSACASVLTAMNSTPLRPDSTMRLTAFVPPPPTPTTLITAR